MELRAWIQELQYEINCMNGSRDFLDAESVRSGQYHVTRSTCVVPFFRDPGGMLSRSVGMPSRNDCPPNIFGTRMVYRETLEIQRRLLHHRRSRIFGALMYQNTHHRMWWGESQTEVQDQRCQSGPSARNSVVFSEGGFPKNYGADQRLQISDLHFDKFPNPATFACWKIWGMYLLYVLAHNFLRKLCCGSKKWRWLIQWMNWDLRHLLVEFQCRILKYSMRGLLQHWTKSSIIPSSKGESVWRNKKTQKGDRFLRGRQIAYLIYDHFRVTGTDDSVENYTDLFTIALRNDDIQEFDSKWDGILLSMTQSHLMTSWKDCTN